MRKCSVHYIAPDKVLFSTEKYLYFSYFFTKTYVVVLVRSALLRPQLSIYNLCFSWRNKKDTPKPLYNMIVGIQSENHVS